MRDTIFGSEEHPTQWTWKWKDDKTQQMEAISLSGTKSNEAMSKLKPLVKELYSKKFDETSKDDEAKKATRAKNAALCKKWCAFLDHYNKMMSLYHKHEDLEDEEIIASHRHGNNMYDIWIDINEGSDLHDVTNYLHCAGCGECTYFLWDLRNLYRYSQQGFEAMMQKIKNYYHHNTNKGGQMGPNAGERVTNEHLLAVFRMCQRHLLWRAAWVWKGVL